MIIHLFQIIAILFLVFLFAFSYIGYGLVMNKLIFKDKISLDFGQLGLFGIFPLIIISYLTSFFTPHNIVHNLIVLLFGIFSFIFLDKNSTKKFQLKILFLIIIFTFTFFIISKNHDDFPYYHLPYALFLSENKIAFGLGLLNYGFRHHSSILFLNSLTFLPWVKYFLFNLPNYLILIFINLSLFNFLTKNLKKKNIVFILSLIFILLINFKFTRLSEYGTDIAGQIILFVIVLNFINILNYKNKIENVYFNIFLLLIIFSFKVYFLLYFILVPLILYEIKINPFKQKKNLKAIFFYFLFSLLFIVHNLINTGCVIYPVEFTCLGDKYFWTLSIEEVDRMGLWLESWSKAGAGPNYKIENLNEYVKGLNWISNWYEKYFLGKFTDFIFLVLLINLLIYLNYNKFIYFNNNFKKIKRVLFITLTIALVFWFLEHPSLRYGGYLPFTISITLISLLFYSDKYLKKKILNKTKVFILIAIFIFNFKNLIRITEEFDRKDQYRFTNFPFYKVIKKDFESLYYENKIYLNITNGYCWATLTPCSNTEYKLKSINNYFFFVR